jgi:RNA polymerase sigma factor (sigma-70 family)
MNSTSTAYESGHESEADIIKKHDRLIRHRAIPFVGHGVTLDDLVQEGRIALLEASRKWDAAHGAALWTYARKFVVGAMFRAVSREINEPSRDLDLDAGYTYTDLGREDGADTAGAILSDMPSPEEIAELGEDLDILESEIDSLGDIERNVLWQIFGEEKDVRSIGETIQISKSAVDRVKRGALEKLRARMAVRA